MGSEQFRILLHNFCKIQPDFDLAINPLATVGAYRRLEILRLWYWERL